ncbi:aminopeptidase P family protein [Parvularcula sp. LCG005]|uniref:aminopeptidase P family protein n=1 Tax=Parvularcula sp. LCG005 TaxID=3078805 RepID=UPI0029439D49|nr:aminopeptidase P family protein [Parvularcula sp. LCG005]WOI52254.1 aminopeptidase P family protein [Parvularcula sp. LCG005]
MFQTFEPASDKTFASQHLPPLRKVLKDMELDGLIVPHDDAYLNEYLPPYAERLMWVSGFSGSAGLGIVLEDKAAVFSDGRYRIQLKDQVDTELFSLHITPEEDPAEWLCENVGGGGVIGYDPLLMSKAGLASFAEAAKRTGFVLKALTENPIDVAWADQPEPPCTMVVPHPDEFSGESSASKRKRLGEALSKRGASAALLTAPHSVAWLFNIRGDDVHASPLPLGRAILFADGTARLFLRPEKVDKTLHRHVGDDVIIVDEADIDDELKDLAQGGACVLVDPALTPLHFVEVLSASGASIIEGEDPCALPRAIKNEIELAGSRQAHIRDGAAVTRFLHWLAQTAPTGTLTEISAAQKLEAFRSETNALRDVSFDTISGAGPHGAICHYRVTTKTDLAIEPGTLYLVDSGGQYQDGTTDITRTIAVGEPTQEMRDHYTLVLKGHIALATARFPKGTSGHQLDVLARLPLWEAGLDYDHGTGHGVGSYLGVHEGPQNISKKPIRQALMPGMICSNEPGYYKTDAYGIRIENLIIVTKPAPIDGGEREMMGFETITMAPLERELINKDLLTDAELAWVNNYHAQVREALTSLLPDETAAWLQQRTAAI